jgi:serine/threonine protein kinase
VEEWLLVDRCAHGAFGVVYRALRIGREAEGPVALKLALFPWDPRFMREVGLLSLVHHPSTPRLLGHGFWQHPSGTFFPFIVMEWVEGTPLYGWAREQDATNLQVLQVLAQLARALEATHARRAVHRDVKGDNVLVRHSDGRAVTLPAGDDQPGPASRALSRTAHPECERPLPWPQADSSQRRLLGGVPHEECRRVREERFGLHQGPLLRPGYGLPPQASTHVRTSGLPVMI